MYRKSQQKFATPDGSRRSIFEPFRSRGNEVNTNHEDITRSFDRGARRRRRPRPRNSRYQSTSRPENNWTRFLFAREFTIQEMVNGAVAAAPARSVSPDPANSGSARSPDLHSSWRRSILRSAEG